MICDSCKKETDRLTDLTEYGFQPVSDGTVKVCDKCFDVLVKFGGEDGRREGEKGSVDKRS